MTDWRGSHQPIADGDELWDIGGHGMIPPDAYEHPDWYAWGEFVGDVAAVVRLVRGTPDAVVRVWRAVPPGVTTLHTGDWVAVCEGYARQHAVQSEDPADDWPVIYADVPARDVRSGGGDLVEWGYWGGTLPARVAAVVGSEG